MPSTAVRARGGTAAASPDGRPAVLTLGSITPLMPTLVQVSAQLPSAVSNATSLRIVSMVLETRRRPGALQVAARPRETRQLGARSHRREPVAPEPGDVPGGRSVHREVGEDLADNRGELVAVSRAGGRECNAGGGRVAV